MVREALQCGRVLGEHFLGALVEIPNLLFKLLRLLGALLNIEACPVKSLEAVFNILDRLACRFQVASQSSYLLVQVNVRLFSLEGCELYLRSQLSSYLRHLRFVQVNQTFVSHQLRYLFHLLELVHCNLS